MASSGGGNDFPGSAILGVSFGFLWEKMCPAHSPCPDGKQTPWQGENGTRRLFRCWRNLKMTGKTKRKRWLEPHENMGISGATLLQESGKVIADWNSLRPNAEGNAAFSGQSIFTFRGKAESPWSGTFGELYSERGGSAEKGNDIPNNREARKQPPDQRKGNRQFNCSPDQCSERKRIISGAVHGIVATVIAAVIAAVVAVAVAGMFFVAVHFSPCPFRNIE